MKIGCVSVGSFRLAPIVKPGEENTLSFGNGTGSSRAGTELLAVVMAACSGP